MLKIARLMKSEGDTLLRRLVIAYAALSASLLSVLVLGILFVIWPNFDRIEKEEGARRAEGAARIVQAEAGHVKELVNTFAVWDDAYAYMAGRRPHFPDENFSALALQQIDVDAVMMIDDKGRMRFSQGASAGYGIDEALKQQVLSAPALRERADEGPTWCLITFGGEIYFAASRRTVRTDGSGPANGAIIFLRRVDAGIVQRISQLANLSVRLGLAGPGAAPLDVNSLGAAVLNDGFGQPVVRVDVLGDHDLANTGAAALITFFVLVCLSWLLMGAVLARLLIRNVVRPVEELRGHVAARSAGAQSGFDGRNRPEEVKELARAFDATFEQLHAEMESHRALTLEAEAARASAEAASQSKSRFVANMSHELRTPLSSIKSYAELMREIAAEDGREQDIRDLDEILQASRHLLELVNNILDLSKVEAGKLVLERRAIDLTALVRGVAAIIRPLAQQNQNRLVEEIGESLVCVGDEVKLRQCLLNLVGNAAKFTANGVIFLGARSIEKNGAAYFCVEVRDTGIGISREALERLFKPFVQADETMTRKFGGTGLGLALTKQLMEAMGGEVEVESVEGKGSTFRLLAPLDHAPSQKTLGAAA